MACQPLTCIPTVINGGETITFTLSDTCHSAALWTAAVVLNNGIAAAATVSGTTNADGTSFDFTISASASAALALGATIAQPLFTKIATPTIKEYGRASQTTVFPAITATATPSPAQAMLTALNAAIITLSASTNSSASFNGQSYTRADLKSLFEQRVRLQAEVLREQQAILAARGGHADNGRIQTVFVGDRCGPHTPFPFRGFGYLP